MRLLSTSHGRERLHSGLNGRVRTLGIGIVLAHEVLHIDHQRLNIRADGFLVRLKGLDRDIPFIIVVHAVISCLIIGQSLLIHKIAHFLRHHRRLVVP